MNKCEHFRVSRVEAGKGRDNPTYQATCEGGETVLKGFQKNVLRLDDVGVLLLSGGVVWLQEQVSWGKGETKRGKVKR